VTITGSTFNIPVYQYSGTKASPLVSFSGNTFTTATPVFTYGALVEDFTDDNTFNHAGGTSSITIQGGILTEDSAWQVAGTASRYVIADHFTVGVGDDAQHCPAGATSSGRTYTTAVPTSMTSRSTGR
jgi:hypothetical protein